VRPASHRADRRLRRHAGQTCPWLHQPRFPDPRRLARTPSANLATGRKAPPRRLARSTLRWSSRRVGCGTSTPRQPARTITSPRPTPAPHRAARALASPTVPGVGPAGRGRSRRRRAGRGSRCAWGAPGTARPSGPGRKISLASCVVWLMTVPAWAVGLPRWGVVLECLAHGLAAVMGMGSPSGSGVGRTAGTVQALLVRGYRIS